MVIETRADGYVNATLICQSTGKQWGHYADRNLARNFFKKLSSELGCKVDDIVQSKRGGNCKGTWIHPQLLVHLQHWCSNKRKRSAAGYVYAVTSDVLNAVKIGMWRGSVHSLKARYITPYGPTVQIATAIVDNCLAAEATLHEQFQQYSLGGELFDKQHHQEYLNALQALDDGN